MKHKIIIILLFFALFSAVLMSTYSHQYLSDNTKVENENNNIITSKEEDISFNGHTYNKNEYPKDSYKLEEISTNRMPSYVIKQFFEDSDFDNNGLLEGREISAMDYKLKHSQYTYNGPYGYN